MKKVLIIGAGPAGITAGYELMKHTGQYDVTILEETPQVGGISKTIQYKGFRMDLGGHCFRTQNETIINWWKEILPQQGAPALDEVKCQRMAVLQEGGPNPELEDDVLLVRKRVAHVLYQDKFFDYPIRMNVNTLRNMGIGSSIKAGFDFVGNSVSRKREVTLEHYYLNRFGKQLYKMFFEDYIEKMWGKHPSKIDTHVGLQYIKGQSVATVIRENDKNIDDPAFFYPKLGAGQMWECAARKFEEMGGIIHTNCTVLKINRENSKVKSLTCVMDGEPIEVETDIVISTMPIKDLINGMSDVPANIVDIASHLCYRDFVTVGLLVPKLNINVEAASKTLGNIIPDTWIYVQDKRRKLARVQIYNNWSPYLLEDPENTVWVGCEFFCEEGDDDWNKSEEEWVRFAKQEMSFLHLISSSTPIYESHKECVKKAYPSYFGSYERMDDVIKYLDGVRNLYCIGRNGQHKCHDMSYAMMTAFAAVKSIVYNVESRASIWDVKQSNVAPPDSTATRSYQTSSPVPPKTNAYVPPVVPKTPSKPISVPSAPVIQVSGQPKKVTKEVLRDVVEKEQKTIKESKEPPKPTTFKTVDKMFASADAVEEEATKLRVKEEPFKKETTVQELRPTLVVQDAYDAEPEKSIYKERESEAKHEPVKFSVRKHEDIVEEPFKEVKFKDDVSETKAEEEKTLEIKDDVEVSEVTEVSDTSVAEEAEAEAEASVAEETEVSVAEEAEAEDEASVAEEAEAEDEASVAEEVEAEPEANVAEEAEAEDEASVAEEAEAEPEANVAEEAEAEVSVTEENEAEAAVKKENDDDNKVVHPLIRNMIPANEVMQRQVVKKSKERTPIPMAKDINRSEAISVSPSVVAAESIDHSGIVKESAKRGEMEAVRQFEKVLSLESPVQTNIEETENARLAEEAEKARLAEEKRLAEEAEKARLAEEKRLAEEAEKARLAEEKRLAEEAEKARLAEEKRLAKEAEKARLAEEKRLAKEAEKARLAEEKRLAKEAEKARLAEEKRLAKETEKARLAEEKRPAKELEKRKETISASTKGKRKAQKAEPAPETLGKTATVGKITGRVIKTRIVEITPEETHKRKKR